MEWNELDGRRGLAASGGRYLGSRDTRAKVQCTKRASMMEHWLGYTAQGHLLFLARVQWELQDLFLKGLTGRKKKIEILEHLVTLIWSLRMKYF